MIEVGDIPEIYIIPLNPALTELKELVERWGITRVELALFFTVIFDEIIFERFPPRDFNDTFFIEEYYNYLEKEYFEIKEESFVPDNFMKFIHEIIWEMLYSCDGSGTRRIFRYFKQLVDTTGALSEDLQYVYFTKRSMMISISS